ncbi:hypothetical protein E2C01_004147 [Portunus trituberculatus]|uniref:Uncharacterized protein n=1 Tax=Portunus trituberculatus TaxID=210409 RepID=A0A5B7CPR3_PORTR|nr:hypothetical protein [Portunus trituberculatus]
MLVEISRRVVAVVVTHGALQELKISNDPSLARVQCDESFTASQLETSGSCPGTPGGHHNAGENMGRQNVVGRRREYEEEEELVVIGVNECLCNVIFSIKELGGCGVG